MMHANKMLLTVAAWLALAPLACADVTSNLQLWWKFNEGSGTSVTDFSGNGVTGTASGSPSWTSGGMVFDGSNDYVDAGDTKLGITTAGTIVVRMTNSGGSGAPQNIAGFGTGSFDDSRLLIDKTAGNDWLGRVLDGGTKRNPSFGTWNNVDTTLAIVVDGTETIVYKNGSAVGSPTSMTTGLTFTGTISFEVGKFPNRGDAVYFNGTVWDVKVYSRKLSATDISDLYADPDSAGGGGGGSSNGGYYYRYNHGAARRPLLRIETDWARPACPFQVVRLREESSHYAIAG